MEDMMGKRVYLNGYLLGQGLGAWAVSTERRVVRVGDVREIGGILMSAFIVEIRGKFFKTYEVSWSPVEGEENTPEAMRKWVNGL